MANFAYYLKVSRPGLWFATIWLYLLPTSQMTSVWDSWEFWFGLFYICFPINFLVYGWNDSVDFKTDQFNKRKDSFWFGARGTLQQLDQLWKPILIVQLLTYPWLIWIAGWPLIPLLAGMLLVNYLYNLPENGLRSVPPLELLCQLGYLLVVPMSIFINDTAALPWPTYIYLFLFAMQSHIMGEVMDIEPDRQANRKTTATILGTYKTKLLIMAIVIAEISLLLFVFQAYVLGGLLAIGLLWLALDLFLIYKTKSYTLFQMKLFALGSNVIAILSMAYVWYYGSLLNTIF